jgi:hypothetical protein
VRAWVLLELGVAIVLALPGVAAAEPPPLPAAGSRLPVRRARAAETAVVRVSDLVRADAARRSFEGALAPLAILQGEEPAEGEDEAEEPFAPAPLESYAFPVPGLAPLVPSPPPSQSFVGLDDIPRVGTSTLVIPPDVDGAVGPSVILEGLNNNYRFYDKATGAGLGTTSITSFWAAAGGTGLFDPRLLYDPVQQRWIAVTLSDSRSTASSILLAVSQTSDPTAAWTLYRVLADSTGTNWADFPSVGFNKNWIAINVNLFTIAANTPNGGRCLIVDYAQARAGSFVASFANGTGFCSAPAATYSSGEPTLFVPTHLSSASGTYRLDTITGTPGSPTYTVGATRARGVNWTQPLNAILPQAPPLAGSSDCGLPACAIETADAQIRSTPVFRDGSIWYTQTVGLPAGVLTHTAVQWTRLEATTGNVIDGGRLDDATATSNNGGKWYAYPHVAVNSAGDAIVCFTQFSSSQYASAGYAMRLASDAAGTLRESVIYKAGEDYYHKDFGSNRNRWGDYAKAQVDPTDDVSMWVVTQYAKARVGTDDGPGGSNASRWGTWWARVGPALTIASGVAVAEGDSGVAAYTVPLSLSQALPTDVTVSYSVSDGSASVADGDYDAPGTPVVIPAGALSAFIPFDVHGDRRYEGGDETFTVAIVSSPGAALGSPIQCTVTIQDADPLPALSVNDVTSVEGNAGNTPFTFTVSLSNPSFQTITAAYSTADSTATVAGGDYTAASGTVSFPPGVTSAPVVVTVKGDLTLEPDEIFSLGLANPTNATIADAQGLGRILDDDDHTPPAVTVLSPNGGETLTGGTSVPLTWLATDASGVDHVDLALSRDGGATYTPIAAGEANDGSFTWDVTTPATVQARLRVTAVDGAGNSGSDVSNAHFSIAFASTAVPDLPAEFALTGIVPNPVVGRASIGYALPRAAHVRLAVADLQGRTLAVLVDGERPAGRHSAAWDVKGVRGGLAAGIYFVRCEAGGTVATRRFAVTR